MTLFGMLDKQGNTAFLCHSVQTTAPMEKEVFFYKISIKKIIKYTTFTL